MPPTVARPRAGVNRTATEQSGTHRRRLRHRRSLIVPILVVLAALTSACTGSARVSRTGAPAPTDTVDPTSPTLVAVGDIASCDRSDDEAVAALVAGLSGTLLTRGDTVYEDGTPSQFRKCYEPDWGGFRPRTRPVPGNHDYEQKGAPGYYDFFGPQAGETGKGWYSYDLAGWHLVALNSNCEAVGGCHYAFGSPLPGSEARNSDTFGALQIALRPDGYDWRFLPVPGASFSDSGSGACH